MNNVTAYYIPADSGHMLYFYPEDVAEMVMNVFLTWAELSPRSDYYAGAAVLIGRFIGERNRTGSYDGVFAWRGREYIVVDSEVLNPPDESAAETDETYR